ncbi:hypothetical protein GCM10028810_14600 [Spirosoma litoris]
MSVPLLNSMHAYELRKGSRITKCNATRCLKAGTGKRTKAGTYLFVRTSQSFEWNKAQ